MSTNLPDSAPKGAPEPEEEQQQEEQHLDRSKYRTFLLKLKFFSVFTEKEIDVLLKSATIRKYQLNEVVFKENDLDISFYVVLSGKCGVFKTSDKYKNIRKVNDIVEGELFGEMSILLGGHRTASVRAGSEAFIMKLQGDHVDMLPAEVKSKMFKQFSIFLAQKLNALNAQVFS